MQNKSSFSYIKKKDYVPFIFHAFLWLTLFYRRCKSQEATPESYVAAFYGLLPIFDVNPLTSWNRLVGGRGAWPSFILSVGVWSTLRGFFSGSGQVLLLRRAAIRGGRKCGEIAGLICITTPSVQCQTHHLEPCESPSEEVHEGWRDACVCVGGDETKGRDLSVILWGVGMGKHGLSWIPPPSYLQHHDGARAPKTAGLMISIDFPLSVCERQGLHTVKFDVFVCKERK